MARHRTHSMEFKRQIAQEFLTVVRLEANRRRTGDDGCVGVQPAAWADATASKLRRSCRPRGGPADALGASPAKRKASNVLKRHPPSSR